jgi:hypothetical protein
VTRPEGSRRGVLGRLALVLMLGMGASAAAEVTLSDRAPLLLRVGERELRVRILPQGLSGGGLQLRRTPQGLTGTLHGQPVELAWNEAGEISGRVAGESVKLLALSLATQSGMSVAGWYGEDPAELSLTPMAITGSVGGCSYSLPRAGTGYSGWRTCDATRGPPVAVALRLPEELTRGVPEGEQPLLTIAEETPGRTEPGTPSP